MSTSGAVTLADIERHGADTRLPNLREIVANDCPRVGVASTYERRQVHYPQLPQLRIARARRGEGDEYGC